MSERANAYRFKTAAQWKLCLGEGFDVAKSGTLQPIPRLGSTARPFTTAGPVTLVAADRFGGPVWRLDSDGRIALVRRTEIDEVTQPFEVDDTLATCTRWVLDRDWLWAFDVAAPIVRRYERDTVDEELVVNLRELTVASEPTPSDDYQIRDLASDGHEGVWLLLEGTDGRWWLKLVQGLIGVGAGLVAFLWPGLTALVLLYIIAFYAIFGGVFQAAYGVLYRKKIRGDLLLIAGGVISVIFGVLLVLFPLAGALALIKVIGIFEVVFGVLLVLLAFEMLAAKAGKPSAA